MMDQRKANTKDKGERKKKINSVHNFMQVCSAVRDFNECYPFAILLFLPYYEVRRTYGSEAKINAV